MKTRCQKYTGNTRDRLFCYIFGSEAHKEWTLSLYNAVNGTAYTDPEQISITTIEQVQYMGMHKTSPFSSPMRSISTSSSRRRTRTCP